MRLAAILGVLAFAILQIAPAPYKLTHQSADASLSVASDPDVPVPVKRVLRRACMDCHSYETRVPWYGQVAPSSWMMAKDVTEARNAMNLSEWGSKSPALHLALSAAACEDVRSGKMPKKEYAMLHPEAKLSAQDIEAICGWSKAVMASMIRKRSAERAQ